MSEPLTIAKVIQKTVLIVALIFSAKIILSSIRWAIKGGETESDRAQKKEHKRLKLEEKQKTHSNETHSSLHTLGSKRLNHCTITGHYLSIGVLTCNHCTIGSLSSTGPLTLHHTTIRGNTSSTGFTEAHDCSLEAFNGTGKLDLKNSKVSAPLVNTGAAYLSNSQLKEVAITGQLTATSVEFQSLHQIGHAQLTSCTAKTGTFTGSLTAEKSSIDDIKVTAKTVNLTDCAAKTLLIRKQKPSKKTTVHISNSLTASPATYIAKIVCEDPTTEIIYGQHTRRTDEITGTTNITYA